MRNVVHEPGEAPVVSRWPKWPDPYTCFAWLGALFMYFRDSRDSRDLLRKKKSFLFLEGHKSRKSRESQEALGRGGGFFSKKSNTARHRNRIRIRRLAQRPSVLISGKVLPQPGTFPGHSESAISIEGALASPSNLIVPWQEGVCANSTRISGFTGNNNKLND